MNNVQGINVLHGITALNVFAYARDCHFQLYRPQQQQQQGGVCLKSGVLNCDVLNPTWRYRLNVGHVSYSQRSSASLFAMSYKRCIQRKRLSTLVSYAFVHGGIVHLGCNTFAIYSVAPLLIFEMGPLPWIAFHLSSAIAAGASDLAMRKWQSTRQAPSGATETMVKQRYRNLLKHHVVGMSGSVFAQFAMFAVLLQEQARWRVLFVPDSWGSLSSTQFFTALGGLSAMFAFQYKQGGRFGHAAHLGGLLYGFAAAKAWTLYAGPPKWKNTL